MIKKLESEKKEHAKKLSEKENVINTVNTQVEALLKEIETLKARNANPNPNPNPN